MTKANKGKRGLGLRDIASAEKLVGVPGCLREQVTTRSADRVRAKRLATWILATRNAGYDRPVHEVIGCAHTTARERLSHMVDPCKRRLANLLRRTGGMPMDRKSLLREYNQLVREMQDD